MLKTSLIFWAIWAFAAQPLGFWQSEALELRLRRNMGYAGGSDIQGTFTLRASGPEDLQQVAFFVDGQSMGVVSQAPFELRFNTGSYALGLHTLVAVGKTASGQELRSNDVQVNFVTASEGFQAGMRIMGPMLAIVGFVMLLTLAASFLGVGKLRSLPPGTPRQYGWAGGAICPRCGRPFPRHFFSPNVVFGKLERCPFCGKWSIVAGAPLSVLRQAEQSELEDIDQEAVPEQVEKGKLQKELDDSRYLDG